MSRVCKIRLRFLVFQKLPLAFLSFCLEFDSIYRNMCSTNILQRVELCGLPEEPTQLNSGSLARTWLLLGYKLDTFKCLARRVSLTIFSLRQNDFSQVVLQVENFKSSLVCKQLSRYLLTMTHTLFMTCHTPKHRLRDS